MTVSDAGKIVLHVDALQSIILRFSKLVCKLDLDTIWEQPDIYEPFFNNPSSAQDEFNSQYKAVRYLSELKDQLDNIIFPPPKQHWSKCRKFRQTFTPNATNYE